ncbi:MAG: ABC transporter ATP-binding protein [Betaproteobacteria bacterium]
MSQPILEMKSVCKSYTGKSALNGIDLSLTSGQVIGILGRNGAGKSTMLECALGLREIDAGQIKLFGESPAALSEASRARIGYVPQQNDLFEWLTAKQMLAYFRAFYTHWNDSKVAALMDRWSIPGDRVIAKLSGGEKQRLAIIRALGHDPQLLILDEPVASLDPAGRRDFLRELIERTIEQETTVVFSTHILSDLERVALEVAIMKDGKIALQQPLDTLAECARRLIGPTTVMNAQHFVGELSRTEDAAGHVNVVVIVGNHDSGQLEQLQAQGVIVEPVGLEDLFIEVTR